MSCCSGDDNEEDQVDYDPANKGPNNKRSCTDIICLLLMIVFCVVWFGIAVYAFANGNPFQLVYPSNSEGEICGQGDYKDRPFLLFFDLTRCIKISAALGGCATPQVCVKECPDQYWTYSMGKQDVLGRFCDYDDPADADTPLQQLVKGRKCPAYLIPSQPFLGRCVPTFGLVRTTNSTISRITEMKTSEDKPVDTNNLKLGIEYLMKAIDIQGKSERFLSDVAGYWWLVLLGLVFAMLISFGWIMLLRLASKPVIWTSIVLCVGERSRSVIMIMILSTVLYFSSLGDSLWICLVQVC